MTRCERMNAYLNDHEICLELTPASSFMAWRKSFSFPNIPLYYPAT
jgi:hypothetical protein